MSNDGPPPGFGTNFGRLGTIPAPTTERDALAAENARLRRALEQIASNEPLSTPDGSPASDLGLELVARIDFARAALAGGKGE